VHLDIAEGTVAEATLRITGAAVTVRFVDEAARVVDDVGYRFAREPTDRGIEESETAHGRRIAGFLLLRPGLGEVEPQAYVGWSPGAWTLLAYRHGYEDLSLPLQLEEGVLTRLTAVLREAPGAEWARPYRGR